MRLSRQCLFFFFFLNEGLGHYASTLPNCMHPSAESLAAKLTCLHSDRAVTHRGVRCCVFPFTMCQMFRLLSSWNPISSKHRKRLCFQNYSNCSPRFPRACLKVTQTSGKHAGVSTFVFKRFAFAGLEFKIRKKTFKIWNVFFASFSCQCRIWMICKFRFFQIYILQSPNFHLNANLMGTNHLSLHLYPEPSSQMFSLNELCIPLCPLPLDCQVLSHCHSERRKLGNPRQRLAGWAARSSHQPVHPPPWQPGP